MNRTPWIMNGLLNLVWIFLVILGMFVFIGPGNMPKRIMEPIQEQPWVYVLLLLMGLGFTFFGIHAIVTKQAFNLTDAAFAKDEYRGRSAVIIGICQCFAGSTLMAAMIYLLLLA